MTDPRYASDPVCGARVNKLRAPAVAMHAGTTHYFCSEACRATFLGRAGEATTAPRAASAEGRPRPRFVVRLPTPSTRGGTVASEIVRRQSTLPLAGAPAPGAAPTEAPAIDDAAAAPAREGEVLCLDAMPPIRRVGSVEERTPDREPRDGSSLTAEDPYTTAAMPGETADEFDETGGPRADRPEPRSFDASGGPRAGRVPTGEIARPLRHLALDVPGLVCPHSALQVERALRRVPGVISAAANPLLEAVVVELEATPDDATHSPIDDKIVGEVRRLGHAASLHRAAYRRRPPMIHRWLFLRFCLAAFVLAVQVASASRPYAIGQSLLGLAAILIAGLPLVADALQRLRHAAINSSTLIVVGALAAQFVAMRETIGGGAAASAALLFEASAALICFALLGQLLERRIAYSLAADRPAAARQIPELMPRLFEAQATKGPRGMLVDGLLRASIVVALAVAVLACLVRHLGGAETARCLVPAIAAIAAYCPFIIGSAVSLVTTLAIRAAAQRLVVFRDARALEELAEVTTLICTRAIASQGTPAVHEAIYLREERTELLGIIAGCEAGSNQPAGRALYEFAARQAKPTAVKQLQTIAHFGLVAQAGTRQVAIGSRELMLREGVDLSSAADAVAPWVSRGESAAYVALDGALAAVFSLADRPRAGMAQLAPVLRGLGVQTVLMTGEPPVAARALARAAGIDNVMAGVAVERRVSEVISARGVHDRVIAVAGDPHRDTAVMLAGDVSIAVSELAACGTHYGVCLVRGTFADVAPAITLARQARAVATVNATVAIVWNLLLIGAAAVGGLGVHAPLIAGMATALVSSLFTAWIRGRLRRLEV